MIPPEEFRRNTWKISCLQETQTEVEDAPDGSRWQPSKPYGGSTWKERIRGALLVFFNKATYVRWW